MVDFSGLVGKTFEANYQDDKVLVHGAYLHDGQVHVIVSRAGQTVYTMNVDCLRRPVNAD